MSKRKEMFTRVYGRVRSDVGARSWDQLRIHARNSVYNIIWSPLWDRVEDRVRGWVTESLRTELRNE